MGAVTCLGRTYTRTYIKEEQEVGHKLCAQIKSSLHLTGFSELNRMSIAETDTE